jgi:hypothetical protein
MENDSVRTSGENTLIDVWIAGKMRSIAVSREAIAGFLQLPPDRAAALSDEDRREFVRTHLSLVVSEANHRLRDTDRDADAIMIEAAPAGRRASPRGDDRRHGDRRKGERRKANLGPPPSGERRR